MNNLSKQGYLNLVRTIRDPLYGPIHLTEQELLIVDHPLFRRLHNVRQNGLLYYIFPSATHTRFEHSLGVVQSATYILEALFHNCLVSSNKPTTAIKESKCKNNKAYNLKLLNDKEVCTLFRILRLTALIHDIGHGPLSHTFDSFAPLRSNIVDILKSEPVLKPLQPFINHIAGQDKNRIEHEEMSCIIFTKIWNDIEGDNIIPQVISSILLDYVPNCIPEQYIRFIPLLRDIIASAPVDADRMDYIERDSLSFGVSYGIYDRPRLLKSFLVYCEETDYDSFHFRLGIKKSGIRAVENFIQARFELFVQVYYHKTNQALEQMLQEVAKIASEESIDIFKEKSLSLILTTYLKLTDKHFVDLLSGEDNKIQNASINEIGKEILNRKLWKRIFDADNEELVDKVYSHINGNEEYRLKKVQIDPKATKDLDKGAKILFRDKDGVYTVSESNWLDHSPMMEALSTEENKIHRIYLKSSDKELAKDLRIKIRNYEHQIRK
ncbi:MAG: hypothetical protein RLN90_01615 [Balneolaceae bacterium]